MSKSFRPYTPVLTGRSIPSPIFAVAFTGVDYRLRVDLISDMLTRPPGQRVREVG